jgi:hypothetical protein
MGLQSGRRRLFCLGAEVAKFHCVPPHGWRRAIFIQLARGERTGQLEGACLEQTQRTLLLLKMLDGAECISYIGAAMRLYYRAYGFTYRYSFTGQRAGETCAAVASKTS